MGFVRLINLALALILRLLDWLDRRRIKAEVKGEIAGERAKEKDATNLKVRGILDKLNSDPAYREEIIRKIKERAHKAQ